MLCVPSFSTICRYQPTAYVAQCVLTYLIHSLQIVHFPPNKKKIKQEEQRKILPTTHSLTHKTQTSSLERGHNFVRCSEFCFVLAPARNFLAPPPGRRLFQLLRRRAGRRGHPRDNGPGSKQRPAKQKKNVVVFLPFPSLGQPVIAWRFC